MSGLIVHLRAGVLQQVQQLGRAVAGDGRGVAVLDQVEQLGGGLYAEGLAEDDGALVQQLGRAVAGDALDGGMIYRSQSPMF